MINNFIRFFIKKYLLMDLKVISLSQVYSSNQLARKRYSIVQDRFKQIYGSSPQYFARAPGRVNLIGQHIDYEGYGVLPFAIQKDCLIAFQVTEQKKLQLHHINSKYPSCVLSNNPFDEIIYLDDYIKYFWAGYRAATKQVISLENIPEEIKQNLQKHKFKGLKLLIQGSVPIAAGLSSSASFVICSAVLTSFANNLHHFVKKQFLIQQAIKYQKLVGMAGGGMDQSISMLGNRQSALYIQFDPIRSERVNLPSGYKFVIMNSLVQSKKLETIGTQYNKRVCECIAAVRILSKNLKISSQLYKNWKILRQLQQYLGLDLPSMARLVDEFLPRKIYTKADIQSELQTQLQNVFKSVINHQIVIKVNTSYHLYEAAKHVYQQADRVLTFIKVCNSKLQPNSKAIILGRLMNESQTSCRQLYNCSSLQIDELTKIAREEGALGSRLTGAGWGGCTISLVPQENIETFKSTLSQRFYTKQYIKPIVQKFGIQNVIFQTIPACGASLVRDLTE